MAMELTTGGEGALDASNQSDLHTLIKLGNQWFAIPIIYMRDIVEPTKVFNIPLSPKEVVGVINLRGRIVVLIDTIRILGIGGKDGKSKSKVPAIASNTNADTTGTDTTDTDATGADTAAKEKPAGHAQEQVDYCFTIEWQDDVYSFTADEIGEVVPINSSHLLEVPESNSSSLRDFCRGLVRSNNQLWLVMDISSMMKHISLTLGSNYSVFQSSKDGDQGGGIDIDLFSNPF